MLCGAPTEARKGLKGPIPAGPISASPNQRPRGITAIMRSKGSAESLETHYGSQTLQQGHVPVPRPSLRTPPGWGHGDTALGPSREAHGLGANGSQSYLTGLRSANIN